jgi:hypothetical protein
VVTGRLDVREAAARLPDEAPEAEEPDDETPDVDEPAEEAVAGELEEVDA